VPFKPRFRIVNMLLVFCLLRGFYVTPVPPGQRQQKSRYSYPPQAFEGLAGETVADRRVILIIENILQCTIRGIRFVGYGLLALAQSAEDENLQGGLVEPGFTK